MSARRRQVTFAAALPLLAVCAAAQTSSGNTTSGSLGTAHTYDRPDLMSGTDPNLSHRQFLARRQEAHKRMLDNATRLLALTREFQQNIRLHDLGAEDGRSLDDIAKLARTLRDQMRQ